MEQGDSQTALFMLGEVRALDMQERSNLLCFMAGFCPEQLEAALAAMRAAYQPL